MRTLRDLFLAQGVVVGLAVIAFLSFRQLDAAIVWAVAGELVVLPGVLAWRWVRRRGERRSSAPATIDGPRFIGGVMIGLAAASFVTALVVAVVALLSGPAAFAGPGMAALGAITLALAGGPSVVVGLRFMQRVRERNDHKSSA